MKLLLYHYIITIPHINIYMLMKVLRHPGHGSSKRGIVGSWTCFSFLKMFHLYSKRLPQF